MQVLLRPLQDYFKGAQCIVRYRLWKWALVPAFTGVAFYAIVLVFILFLRLELFKLTESWIDGDAFRFSVVFITGFITGLLLLYLAFLFFKYAVLILSAPFMTVMSERIEAGLYGNNERGKLSLAGILSDLKRSFLLNSRNFLIEMLWVAALFAVGLFFPPALFLALLLWGVQAYFAGFGNMDYTLERYFNIRESIDFARRYRIMVVGNGAIFILLLSIPLIGALVAIPFATAASTVGVLRVLKENYDSEFPLHFSNQD
ncbi:MAG: hypothetical protein EA411_02025 [Saprospirales bacterium]|nr:MAG: hypothetical protein EA411_02025 [Saprospirales bacterium]